MKTTYKLLLSFALTFASVIAPSLTGRAGGGSLSAQTIGEAFYIYRNDGGFNAFFREEIDSITYSCYDLDSLLHEDVVTQVVFTEDSVYRIPLEVIDSVSFVQPETILKSNVTQMDKKGLLDYLKFVDGMSLLFTSEIPFDLRPQVGDVLLSTDFNHPLLCDGFAGKVLGTQIGADAFRVDCDSIYDIFDIFDQLISIEKMEYEEPASVKRNVSGEWISNRNILDFNLGYSHPVSDGNVSLSGSVSGTYIATVSYNITQREQYINVRIDHDWQYGAHLGVKCEKGFGTLKGPVASLPAIRFPAVAPVFKFQIAGVPFVKGEGNMELALSLSSPAHAYVSQATYRNGLFSGWNRMKPSKGSISPSFETAFSLNGSVQAGFMVDLWLGLDIFGSAFKMGTGLDFYIGPKLKGDFSIKMGIDNPINYYSTYEDSKIGIDWLHVDYEFFGEAALAGHHFPEAVFCNGGFQSPLYHKWYIMPEFSDLSVVKDDKEKKAIISTTPSRDILFPLSVGLGLYNEGGDLLNTKYESRNYKRENEGFEIQQEFSSLELNKEYTAKPFIKFLGGEIPALPEEKFKLEGETSCPDDHHPHMIDLGIGPLWSCCNVGASTPEQYGNYYAWGETQPKSVYNEVTYKYYSGKDTDGDGYYDINISKIHIGPDISGTQYDAARANLGAPWRMPTIEECNSLSICTCEWTTVNGVKGCKFTGPSGNSIFLPAAGGRYENKIGFVGSQGGYWTSMKNFSFRINSVNESQCSDDTDVVYGLTVRPVRFR